MGLFDKLLNNLTNKQIQQQKMELESKFVKQKIPVKTCLHCKKEMVEGDYRDRRICFSCYVKANKKARNLSEQFNKFIDKKYYENDYGSDLNEIKQENNN